MNSLRVILLANLVLLSTQIALAVVDFYPKVDYPTGISPMSVFVADLNIQDTIRGPDLIVVNSSDNNVSVFKNNGNGTFAARVNYPTGLNPQAVFAAYLNGDQQSDLVVANNGNNTVSVLINNGNGTFASKVDYATGDKPASVVAINLDGPSSGLADLAVADLFDDKVSILKNNGNGTFATNVQYATGDDPIWIVAAFLNNDTLPDLVTANRAGNSVSVLINAGGGTFPTHVEYPVGGDPRSVFAADLDGDGDQDLAVANYDSNTVSVLKNNGNGTFATKVNYPTGISPRSVIAADIDKDLRPELVVTNEGSDSVSVLKNNGDGTFAAKKDYPTGLNPVSVFAGDLDVDNDSDLVVVNNADADLSVLENRRCQSFALPVNYSAGISTSGFEAADFFVGQLGGNSAPDVVVVDSYADKLIFHQNSGTGTFSQVGSQVVAGTPIRSYGGYFDSDGNLDLAVIDEQTPQVIIMENTGGFNFPVVQFLPLDSASAPQDLHAVNLFAGGGSSDLVVANRDSNSVSVFQSTGTSSPSFNLIGNYHVGKRPLAVTAADVDQDGDQDLITMHRSGPLASSEDSVTVLRKKGNGIFADTARADYPVALENAASLFADDFNGDSYPDLAVTGSSGAPFDSASLLINNGDGSFASPVLYPVFTSPAYYPKGLIAAKLVGEDLFPDLAVPYETGTPTANVSILKNRGDGTLVPQFESFHVGGLNLANATMIFASDLDGDGDQDLVANGLSIVLDAFISVLLSEPQCPPLPADSCIATPGDPNASEGVPNLQDVIYLVNFVFDKSRVNPPCNGTDPISCWPVEPLCRGDANGSGGVPNLQDVIYLVNFVFDKDRLNPPCNGTDPGNCWTPVSTGVCCLPVP